MKKALIVVDVQNDFCPGGSLAVQDGDKVVPIINKMIPEFDLVIFTMDWHPKNSDAFASNYKGKKPFDKYINAQGEDDVLWPAHCVQDTIGAELHKDLDLSLIKGDFYFFKKGLNKDEHPYSGFGADGLLDFLTERGVTETYITGLATDYCVKATALDSVKNHFITKVVWDATRGIADDLGPTMNELFNNGVILIDYEYFQSGEK